MSREEQRILKKQLNEVTHVLGSSVKAALDNAFGEDAVNFFWDNDDPVFDKDDTGVSKTVLKLPAVNFYNPEMSDIPTLYSNQPVIKDKDEVNLSAKEFPPYQYLDLDYAFRIVCADPDTDLTLQNFFIGMRHELPSIEPLVSEEPFEKFYVQLHWDTRPKTYNYDKRLLVRAFTVTAKLRLESRKFIKRKLISPSNPVSITGGEGYTGDSGVSLTLTHTLSTGTKEVYVSEDTTNLPPTGVLVFGRNGEEFRFSFRRLNRFIGDECLKSYHFAGESLVLKEDS